jgi:uncharacterized membrane protein YkvA (DUF1232 family)
VRGALIGLGIAAAVWLAVVVAMVIGGRKTAVRELARLLPNVLALFRGLLRDPRVPSSAKVALVAGIVWIASPIDLIPEFVPVAGPLDDAFVAALVLRYVMRRAGPHLAADHWRGDPRTLAMLLRFAGARER